MYKYLLESAGNINWMAIAALLTFVTIFLVSAVLVFKKDPAYIRKMAALPLDDSNFQTSETEDHHDK